MVLAVHESASTLVNSAKLPLAPAAIRWSATSSTRRGNSPASRQLRAAGFARGASVASSGTACAYHSFCPGRVRPPPQSRNVAGVDPDATALSHEPRRRMALSPVTGSCESRTTERVALGIPRRAKCGPFSWKFRGGPEPPQSRVITRGDLQFAAAGAGGVVPLGSIVTSTCAVSPALRTTLPEERRLTSVHFSHESCVMT